MALILTSFAAAASHEDVINRPEERRIEMQADTCKHCGQPKEMGQGTRLRIVRYGIAIDHEFTPCLVMMCKNPDCPRKKWLQEGSRPSFYRYPWLAAAVSFGMALLMWTSTASIILLQSFSGKPFSSSVLLAIIADVVVAIGASMRTQSDYRRYKDFLKYRDP